MSAAHAAPAAADEGARRAMASLPTKLFYGVGSVAFGVKDQGFAYFLLFFYNQVLGAPAEMIGRAIAVALFFDAFADPIVGQISDGLRSRWGRRHPFMYASVAPVVIGYFFLWNPPHLSGGALFAYLVAIIIVVRTFITFYEIPSSALVAELTSDYDERTSFLGYRYLFGWLGGLAMTLLAFGLFFKSTRAHPIGQLNPDGYVEYSIAACVMMAAAILVSALGTHRFIPYFLIPPKRNIGLARVFAEMADTLKNRSFIVLAVSALLAAVATGSLTALNTYFNTFFWGLSARQILLVNVIVIAAPVLALFLAPALSSRLGKKAAAMGLWIASMTFYWLPMGARLAGVFPPNGDPWLLPLLVPLQTTGTMLSIACSITTSSMLADVVEDSQRRTGRRSEGLFFSANAFILKAVSGMGILVATVLLALVHFPAHADPAHLDPQIPRSLALTYFPVTVGLYGLAVAALAFYRIDRAAHAANLARLAEEALHAPMPVGLEGVRTPEHGDPIEDIPG